MANSILYELATKPGIRVLYVCPREEQALVFVHTRLQPMLEQSPYLRRVLLGGANRKLRIKNMRFANESQLYVRAAYHSADSARGISADLLVIDEFQDVAGGTLAVLQETLSHSPYGRILLTGPPKLIENGLEGVYSQSTANEWTLACGGCSACVILDERCLGPSGIICPTCQSALDVRTGHWVARNPQAEWGEGYWLNHLMAPWLNYHEILERRRSYDLAQFKNEVLGLPTTLGEHVVTRAELEACCSDQPMAQSLDDIPVAARDHVIAGIDWGGGRTSRTVVTIGYYRRSENKFVIARFERFRADEDPRRLLEAVAALCRRFRVQWIGADGAGNGLTTNRLLLDQLKYRAHLYGIVYSDSDHPPVQDGTVWMYTVHRTGTLGLVYSLIRKRSIEFPRGKECGSFLDEMACELAEYDDHRRTIRYVHPANQQDDALHSTNYAMVVLNRWLDGVGRESRELEDF